jgi:8-oxo-dGTP pyrophosphatase MutT (NUDIX family)
MSNEWQTYTSKKKRQRKRRNKKKKTRQPPQTLGRGRGGGGRGRGRGKTREGEKKRDSYHFGKRWDFTQFVTAGIILRQFDQVLLVKGRLSQKWGFPKGRVQHGESMFEAACRELKEETGYVTNESAYPCIAWTSRSKSNTMYFSLQKRDIKRGYTPKYDKNEIECVRWISLKKLSSTFQRNQVTIDLWIYIKELQTDYFLPCRIAMTYKPPLEQLEKAEKRSAAEYNRRHRRLPKTS